MTDAKRFAVHDLPADHFPVLMRGYLVSTGRLVWLERVETAPVLVTIPALARQHGGPVRIEIEFATGEILEAGP